MRTLAIVLLAVLAVSAFAIQAKKPSLATMKKIENMQANKKSWSSFIIQMAMLNAKAGNPLDELIVAIEKVVQDLDAKLEKANGDFDSRTGEHDREIKRLQSEMDDANADVAHTEQFLKEVLYVQKAGLEADIDHLQADIVVTRKFLEDLAINRDREHSDFNTKETEIRGGIAAVQEAFTLLGSMLDGSASLAQVAKAKNALLKVQKKLHSSVDQTIIKALVQIASSGVDPAIIRKILDSIHTVSENLKAGLEKLIADEQQAQTDYEALVKQKEEEIKQFESDILTKKGELEVTVRKIETEEAFVVQRKADSVTFTEALKSENANFEHDTKVFEDLVLQFNKEITACNEALDLLRSAEFSGYLNDRLNQYGPKGPVIASNHGSGVAVN